MKINCKYHGYIDLCKIAETIIKTNEFQRLRYIKQTGVLYYEFPTATHSRYEHSIGTYYLARKMITKIKIKQPELCITEEIVMLVSIAGLCHDLGHLMFSHLFDDYFVAKIKNKVEQKNLSHEERSIFLLNHIVKKYNVNLDNKQLQVIIDLIIPQKSNYESWELKYKIGKWIFQIISNPINSIDVDKFDYLTRDADLLGYKVSFDYNLIMNDAKVINDIICYSSHCCDDIYRMFFLRYRLHRNYYNHPSVKGIEILIIKILEDLDSSLNICEYLLDADKMILLIDSFILNHPLLTDIHECKYPQMVYEDINILPVIFDDSKLKEYFDEDKYYIMKFKVGYVNSKTNLLNNITFYDYETNNIITENTLEKFSLFINKNHQEYFIRVYCIDLNLINEFKKFF